MTNIRLGEQTRVDPRTVFVGEATDFTPWLAENLSSFNRALGLEIELVQREMPVGDFAVDIFGKEVGSGHEVIIENQLAPTDHSHLGQLLTYAAGLDVKIVVWISPKFRDEHKQALDWLNRDTTEGLSFFGVELELLQIGDSLPAPNFNVVAQPSEWQRRVVGTTTGGFSQRQLAYHEFFADLLSRLKSRRPQFTSVSRVGYDNWISFAPGRSGFSLNPTFGQGNRFRVEMYIDIGDQATNKVAFDQLHGQKEEIEESIGGPLTWARLDHRRASVIHASRDGSIGSPPEILEDLKGWAVERLLRFKDVLGPRIQALDLMAVQEMDI